ncbi:MAG TPA: hypothetical protein VLV50_13380 [Stellaceae bacterium]|nr:hypothetical protein [Stellaceae bacterium]
MMRLAMGAALVLALAAASGPVRADGALKSLSDLDGGAQDWHAIAPGSGADKKPADPLTSSAAAPASAPAATTRGVKQIDDTLAIDTTPPPPPPKPVPSLWFTQPTGRPAQGK